MQWKSSGTHSFSVPLPLGMPDGPWHAQLTPSQLSMVMNKPLSRWFQQKSQSRIPLAGWLSVTITVLWFSLGEVAVSEPWGKDKGKMKEKGAILETFML